MIRLITIKSQEFYKTCQLQNKFVQGFQTLSDLFSVQQQRKATVVFSQSFETFKTLSITFKWSSLQNIAVAQSLRIEIENIQLRDNINSSWQEFSPLQTKSISNKEHIRFLTKRKKLNLIKPVHRMIRQDVLFCLIFLGQFSNAIYSYQPN